MNCNDFSIATVKEYDYRTHFLFVNKDEATDLLRNADFTVNIKPL